MKKRKAKDLTPIIFVIVLLALLFAVVFLDPRTSSKWYPHNYEKGENYRDVKKEIRNQGYEFKDVYYAEGLGTGGIKYALLEMYSLGNRNKQVWDGLMTLGTFYEEAQKYYVGIFPANRTGCLYIVDGNILKEYLNTQDQELYDKINYNITSKVCP